MEQQHNRVCIQHNHNTGYFHVHDGRDAHDEHDELHDVLLHDEQAQEWGWGWDENDDVRGDVCLIILQGYQLPKAFLFQNFHHDCDDALLKFGQITEMTEAKRRE